MVGNTGSNVTSQTTKTNNYNNNDKGQQSYNSTMNSTKSSYSSSSGTKKSVPPLDEQTQLDLILSDLLNEQAFVSSPTSPKSASGKETRTFRTYDTHTSPGGKTSYQTAEVTYKIPGGYKEEKTTVTRSEEKQAYVPPNAFSYTTSPELARKANSPKTQTLPYRTDYDNRYNDSSYRTMESSRSMSPTDTTASWLQEQQHKLRQRKDSKSEMQVEQERQLVEELKSAQNKFISQKAQKQQEEKITMDTFNKVSSPPRVVSPVANGPVTTYNYQVSRNNNSYSNEKPQPNASAVNVSWPPVNYNPGDLTSYSTTTYRTETKSGGVTKPPPSPGQTRQIIYPAPVSPPARSSSKDYMQRNRTTSNSSWQGGSSNTNSLNRQYSDRYDVDIRPPVVKTITITTPPLSPRLSPKQQNQNQIQNTYKVNTVQRINTIQPSPVTTRREFVQSNTSMHHAPTKTKTTEVQELDHTDGHKNSNYITEVYINRSPSGPGRPLP